MGSLIKYLHVENGLFFICFLTVTCNNNVTTVTCLKYCRYRVHMETSSTYNNGGKVEDFVRFLLSLSEKGYLSWWSPLGKGCWSSFEQTWFPFTLRAKFGRIKNSLYTCIYITQMILVEHKFSNRLFLRHKND